MSVKINAKTVRETLDEHLASDSEILKAAGEIFVFYVAASSGSPLALAAGIGLILSAAASAVKGASFLIKRFCGPESDSKMRLAPYERFRIVFYASCIQAYFDAIREPLEKLRDDPSRPPSSESKTLDLAAALRAAQSKAEESETPFLLGVDPLRGEVPLYCALSEWLTLLLKNYGYSEYRTQAILEQATLEAKQRFHVFVASETADAAWIRNYLLVESQEQAKAIANDLASVRSALESWLPRGAAPKAKRLEAWQDYRKQLSLLPDQKDSMYSEEFGVREVFIRPDGTYAVAGAAGDAGKPQRVANLGSVIGGLLSTRVSGEELIILCGGPGSGKSTLCRVLASELASDPSVFPVFLRLRRLKEGSDIPAFLEGQLSSLGLIDRIIDLRNLGNAVVILDGFDELVMASRARLRHFFNSLREDHTSGPLRNLRIIVSGRDTLFPSGEGLPLGSHVLTLLPFDRTKVAAWSAKWRSKHESGGGATFRPEALLDDEGKKVSALHHLVTWPLTLHLVARVHTSGGLTVADKSSGTLTKAILYRSILAETATRQREQTDGTGRLEPRAMRELLRAIAWRMYEEGRDSMDPSEVLPILETFLPGRTEAELAELADVAVVNSPEITKGEQTGFEFVHKSFAEYLTAEQIAISTARVTFQAPEFDSEQLTWRMTDTEAANEVAKFLAIRVLTPEVQEMLEPMLGDFDGFARGTPRAAVRADGLSRIIKRFEMLLESLLRGKLARIIDERAAKVAQVNNLLEGFANFGAGIAFTGAAAARQLEAQAGTGAKKFSLEPFDGAFWRLLCLIHAGGLYVDQLIASRLVNGCTVARKAESGLADTGTPIKTAWLRELDGFQPRLEYAVRAQEGAALQSDIALQFAVALLVVLAQQTRGEKHFEHDSFLSLDRPRHYMWDFRRRDELASALADAELVQPDILGNYQYQSERLRREVFDRLNFISRERGETGREYPLREIAHELERTWPGPGPGPIRMVLELWAELNSRMGGRKQDWTDRLFDILRR